MTRSNYHLKYPWMSSYTQAKQRCTNKNNPKYHRYGGRGIKFLLTKAEIKELWFRDKGYNLKRANIDRENNDGNYTFDNCRFIELKENTTRSRKLKPIIQYDLQGNFIKEWVSIREASRQLNIPSGNICHVLKGRKFQAYNFIFDYKEKEYGLHTTNR